MFSPSRAGVAVTLALVTSASSLPPHVAPVVPLASLVVAVPVVVAAEVVDSTTSNLFASNGPPASPPPLADVGVHVQQVLLESLLDHCFPALEARLLRDGVGVLFRPLAI
jgi:hypothetical protein